jgi:hypothetical protein
MTYRIYLRTFDGHISEKTITKNQDAAAEAFTALVVRTDLNGQKLAAALTYNNSQLAFHRFDCNLGDRDYWRDKLDEIEWPSAGRPAEMEGGRRVNVYLDADSLDTASKLGNGNVSDGIRKALKQAG